MRRGALATLIATALVLLWTPPPGSALTVSQSVSIPSTGKVVIKGHGYGHGHGMSQWGAQGAATGVGGPKLGWPQILDFYYPGTQLTDARRLVKVLISADTSDDVVVAARSGLGYRDGAGSVFTELPTNLGATRWKLDVAAGRTVLDYLAGSTWKRWKTLAGEGSFRAKGLPVTLYYAGGSRQFRGTLIAAAPTAGSSSRSTVNQLSIDNYVKGVVPREVYTSWAPDALAAQAVAARTYASYLITHESRGYYDVCDTTSCQVYGGYSDEVSSTNAAVTATRGKILTYDGSPAFTQFSASSGGWTSAGSVPYMPNKQDPYDAVSGNSSHAWSVTVDVAKIERAYPAVGNLTSIRFTSREGGGEWQGRAWSMVLVGVKNGSTTRVPTHGDEFRSRLGLKSSWFMVSRA